jgi:hypothetical protein
MAIGGNCPLRSAWTTLIRQAIPAASNGWPMFGFSDPMAQKPVAFEPSPKLSLSALSSASSPRVLLVPCASTNPMLRGSMPVRSNTSRWSCPCRADFGAVRPFLAPSWLMPQPRMTASM